MPKVSRVPRTFACRADGCTFTANNPGVLGQHYAQYADHRTTPRRIRSARTNGAARSATTTTPPAGDTTRSDFHDEQKTPEHAPPTSAVADGPPIKETIKFGVTFLCNTVLGGDSPARSHWHLAEYKANQLATVWDRYLATVPAAKQAAVMAKVDKYVPLISAVATSFMIFQPMMKKELELQAALRARAAGGKPAPPRNGGYVTNVRPDSHRPDVEPQPPTAAPAQPDSRIDRGPITVGHGAVEGDDFIAAGGDLAL